MWGKRERKIWLGCGTCGERKFPDWNNKLRKAGMRGWIRRPRTPKMRNFFDEAAFITMSSWIFPSPSFKRLLLAS